MLEQKLVVNCETGEESYVPLTAEEIVQREADSLAHEASVAAKNSARAAEEAARESARAKLAALGLNEAEVAALVK
jgi:hypothetical protein